MEYSVNSGRTSLSDEKIGMVKHCKIDKAREDESFALSERTRSPRRRPPHDEPWKRSPSNRYDFDVREVQWSGRDDRDRVVTVRDLQQGLRGSRPTYVRDLEWCRRYPNVRDEPDYCGRDRARGSNDPPPPEQPREPRPYVKRPRSPDRQNRDRQRRYD